jgi:hypothetical protein
VLDELALYDDTQARSLDACLQALAAPVAA